MGGKTIGEQGLCPTGCGERLSHGRPGNPARTFAKNGCPTGGTLPVRRGRHHSRGGAAA